MNLFQSLLGKNSTVDFSALKKEGAQIVDVRSPKEYEGGHIVGSLNIPLQDLSNSLGKLDENKTIITCCASGVRSGNAKNFLKRNGFDEVYNGGGWKSLKNKLRM